MRAYNTTREFPFLLNLLELNKQTEHLKLLPRTTYTEALTLKTYKSTFFVTLREINTKIQKQKNKNKVNYSKPILISHNFRIQHFYIH